MIEISEYDTPWEVACKIIGMTATHEILKRKVTEQVFEPSDIKAIGKHLINYADAELERQGGE